MLARSEDAGQPVAINARAAVRSQIGGVERLAREMACRLPALRPDRYRVIKPPASLAHRAGHLWEQGVLPFQARNSALIYSPANLAPVWSRRNVVVIHDAAPLSHPEAYSTRYVAYQRRVLASLAGHSRVVITVSEFSRCELIELLALPAERIRVVPEGVDERFGPGVDSRAVKDRHRLRRPYVLAIGTPSARKNLGVLGPAAHALGEQGIELVLAGSDRGYLRGSSTALRRLGYVPEADLPGLYAGARALVMPSLHEGFGLPCLEAMASGIPVIAANAGALPETVGDAALLVDPREPHAFAQALLEATVDGAVRQRLISAGLTRAAGYPWQRTAQLTDQVLGELLEAD